MCKLMNGIFLMGLMIKAWQRDQKIVNILGIRPSLYMSLHNVKILVNKLPHWVSTKTLINSMYFFIRTLKNINITPRVLEE